MSPRQLTPIAQTDPKAGYMSQRKEIDAAVQRVLENGWYILGQEVEAFEHEFAAFVGVADAIGTASGTDALVLALRACEIGPGDLVLTVSHTAVATVAAIELVGATPLLVDIKSTTFTLDPSALRHALAHSPNGLPKAVIPVHLYGHPADIAAIMELADHFGLFVIEDCAQSHGATVAGRMTGSWGHISAFSFYPTKNLGAMGDGGMVVTDNNKLAHRVRLLRQYGWQERYVSDIPGENSRLDELQAAILRVKLHALKAGNERRNTIAGRYTKGLEGTGLTLPSCRKDSSHVYHQYVVQTPHRDSLQAFLREQGIGTVIHYPMAVHQQPAYSGRIPIAGSLLKSERAVSQVLSLPMYPELTEGQVDFVIDAIQEWMRF
jgi:dTDP-4-amino-4,6-dideoxygalactose transaminase